MRLLLHTCCAPCAIYPTKFLQEIGYKVTLYFYNPNIHPYREFKKRLVSVQEFSQKNHIPLILEKKYLLEDFLRSVVFRENKRCSICQELRIKQTTVVAKQLDFPSFSTSLLYSRYQNHEEIKNQCALYSHLAGLEFVYNDFRVGWEEGVDSAMSQGLYRQSYCGCIFSESDRYDKSLRKVKKHANNDNPCHEQ